jgi:hypothetical protein
MFVVLCGSQTEFDNFKIIQHLDPLIYQRENAKRRERSGLLGKEDGKFMKIRNQPVRYGNKSRQRSSLDGL